MALTIQEQLQILKGDIQPPSNLFIDVVHQVAHQEALDFYNNYKTFDKLANQNAWQYVVKILQVADFVFQNNINVIKSLERLIISIYSPTGNFPTVQSASDSQWAGFAESHMIEAFEILGSVSRDEKTEYDGLP